ncbi:hypothetical protein SAMN02787149_1272 [Pseudomonas sp. Snoq117.2]|nr:hypothetical protein SAMN02787149_1272 [Pseudomonas sp. Snoq117.2]
MGSVSVAKHMRVDAYTYFVTCVPHNTLYAFPIVREWFAELVEE